MARSSSPWTKTSPGVPSKGSRPSLTTYEPVHTPGNLIHGVGHQNDGGVPAYRGYSRIFSRMASRPRGSSPAVGSSKISTLGSMAMHARRWPPGASGPPESSKGDFSSTLSGRSDKVNGRMHPPVDLLLRPASCCRDRRRCPCRRSPQRADTPGTETPAPPGSGSARIVLGLFPDVPARRKSTLPEVGFSSPFRCWIRVDLPEPVWPMMPRNFAGLGLEIHVRPERCVQRACRRCKCGSASVFQ